MVGICDGVAERFEMRRKRWMLVWQRQGNAVLSSRKLLLFFVR